MASAPLTNLREAAAPFAAADQSVRILSVSEATAPHFHAQWQALATQAAEPNPFFEPWFLLPSIRLFGQEAKLAAFAVLHEGVLIGLMPLDRSKRYYKYPIPHFAGWTHANMFCGAPLVAKGFERAFWLALLDYCDTHIGTELFLHLPALPIDGPLASALAKVVSEQGRKAAKVESHERAFLQSEMTSGDYFAASLSTKKRKELRRQQRRFGRIGKCELCPGNRRNRNRPMGAGISRAGTRGMEGTARLCIGRRYRHPRAV